MPLHFSHFLAELSDIWKCQFNIVTPSGASTHLLATGVCAMDRRRLSFDIFFPSARTRRKCSRSSFVNLCGAMIEMLDLEFVTTKEKDEYGCSKLSFRIK
jgi:hypothetical protein